MLQKCLSLVSFPFLLFSCHTLILKCHLQWIILLTVGTKQLLAEVKSIIQCNCVHREISKPLVPLGQAGVLLVQILKLLCKEMVGPTIYKLKKTSTLHYILLYINKTLMLCIVWEFRLIYCCFFFPIRPLRRSGPCGQRAGWTGLISCPRMKTSTSLSLIRSVGYRSARQVKHEQLEQPVRLCWRPESESGCIELLFYFTV